MNMLTPDSVRETLPKLDGKQMYRVLQAMFQRQTADEQSSHSTSHNNGVGFNGFDAPLLSDIAERSKRYESLTPKQTALVAKMLKKYAKQIASIAIDNAATMAENKRIVERENL